MPNIIHKIGRIMSIFVWMIAVEQLQPNHLFAQTTNFDCGSIIEGEFTKGGSDNLQNYSLSLSAGDTIQLKALPLGDFLQMQLRVFGPTGLPVAQTGRYIGDFATNAELVTGVLSARGVYSIELSANGPGIYTLYIACTLRDGTVINPGDIQIPTNNSSTNPSNITFSGVGFPGLAPVDFSAVAKIPMIANVLMTGAVAPDGNLILGYTVDAAANDTLALSFTRLSGNLNLGLVVLSADNKVVFQASLVTSSELTTTFTLPSAGQYTIGVFRIDLLPPAAPEPTAFQLQATLNP